jgi:hypothetical protein
LAKIERLPTALSLQMALLEMSKPRVLNFFAVRRAVHTIFAGIGCSWLRLDSRGHSFGHSWEILGYFEDIAEEV